MSTLNDVLTFFFVCGIVNHGIEEMTYLKENFDVYSHNIHRNVVTNVVSFVSINIWRIAFNQTYRNVGSHIRLGVCRSNKIYYDEKS